MKNEKGFTLIEMMIVMLIISILLIITIPNIAKHNVSINDKGCQAFVKMVQAEEQAFEIDNKRVPTGVDELVTEGYLKKETQGCPDGKSDIQIASDGTVTAVPKTAASQ